jgi:lipoprotein signal peptidase
MKRQAQDDLLLIDEVLLTNNKCSAIVWMDLTTARAPERDKPEVLAMTRPANAVARTAKVWLDIVFFVGAAAGIGMACWLVVSPLVLRGGQVGDTAIPVAVGSGSLRPALTLDVDTTATASIRRAVLVEARGELRIQSTSWSLQFFPNLGMLFGIAIVLYVLLLLRRILGSVLAGDPFAAANANRMRIIGVILVAAGALGPVAEYLAARSMLRMVHVSGVELTAPFDLRLDVILAGLLLLVLAAVFGYGSELERERSLTV